MANKLTTAVGPITMDDLRKIAKINPNAEAELCRRAFDLVADATDWKRPVCKVLDTRELAFEPEVIAHAVGFMTATAAHVGYEYPGPRVKITAPGYYRGPAN